MRPMGHKNFSTKRLHWVLEDFFPRSKERRTGEVNRAFSQILAKKTKSSYSQGNKYVATRLF